MKPHGKLLAVVLASLLTGACAPGAGDTEDAPGGGGAFDFGEAITDGIEFEVPATERDGNVPEGSSDGPQVLPLSEAPAQIVPGQRFELRIAWQGGAIDAVNVGFGGSRYFEIPVPAAGAATEGVVVIPATVSDGVIVPLPGEVNITYQVRGGDGTFSLRSVYATVLCTGEGECSSGGGGAGGSSGCDAVAGCEASCAGLEAALGRGNCVFLTGCEPGSCEGSSLCGCELQAYGDCLATSGTCTHTEPPNQPVSETVEGCAAELEALQVCGQAG